MGDGGAISLDNAAVDGGGENHQPQASQIDVKALLKAKRNESNATTSTLTSAPTNEDNAMTMLSVSPVIEPQVGD